jgi:hypothetical protein
MSENINIKISNVRLSYPNLFRAKAVEGSVSEPKFSAAFLLDKKTNAADIKRIQEGLAKLVKEAFEGKRPGPDKLCLKDGSNKADTDGYGESVMFVNASSTKRPVIVNRDLAPLAEEDGKPYAGCIVNGVFNLWAQDNKYGKRINASLTHVQFVKDGEPFGEKTKSAEEVFTAIEEDDAV